MAHFLFRTIMTQQGIVIVAGWSVLLSYVISKVLDAMIGLRVAPEVEIEGLVS